MTAAASAFDREKHEAQRTVGQFMHHAGICSCGSPEEFLRLLLGHLERFDGAAGQAWKDRSLKDPLNLTFAVVLDCWELTEHGGSIFGAWLTSSGVRLRDALRRLDLGDVGRSSVDLDELLPSYKGGWWSREHQYNPRTRDGVPYAELGEWETGL